MSTRSRERVTPTTPRQITIAVALQTLIFAVASGIITMSLARFGVSTVGEGVRIWIIASVVWALTTSTSMIRRARRRR